MKKTKKIGVLGGAFNPPTIGHINLAKHTLSHTDLDSVWLMPCYDHLYGKDLVSASHRLNMCRSVSETFFDIGKTVRTFDYEIRHKMDGSTYSCVKKLLDDPDLDVDISMIIGQDNANSFHKFKKADELSEMVKFIVVGRGGVEKDCQVKWYLKDPHTYIPWEEEACSSTMIRDHISTNGYEKYDLLDNRVLAYIKSHHLYRGPEIKTEKSERSLKELEEFNKKYYSSQNR